ncbi:MAG: serine/threonine protein kinase [Myxococcales bacterium]|nr:serine/threonine protein kinase [Myxococcales bacterium]
MSHEPTEVDRYEILAPIGRGGFGAVYLARHKLTGREVALKLSDPKSDPELVARALNEARIAASMQHPSLVPVFDCGALADGRIFVVMERIDGRSLESIAALEGGRLELARAVALVDQVLSALELVHARGIVHRDIKPSNVLVRREADGRERAFLIDFGISKIDERAPGAEPALTMVGSILGTPGYMPPEQFDARSVDARADLFSVGALLFRLVAGRPVVECATVTEWLVAVTQRPLPSLSTAAPWAPPDLCAVVDRALARDRDARPTDASTMRAWLHSALRGEGPGSLAPMTARVEAPTTPTTSAPPALAAPSIASHSANAASIAPTVAARAGMPRGRTLGVAAAMALTTIGAIAVLSSASGPEVEDDTSTVTTLDPAHRAALSAAAQPRNVPQSIAPSFVAPTAAPPVAQAAAADAGTSEDDTPTQSSAPEAPTGASDAALLRSESGRLRFVGARQVGDVEMDEVVAAVRRALTAIESCHRGAGAARASITIMFRGSIRPVFSEPASEGGALARCVEGALSANNPAWRSGTRSDGILADAEFIWR